MNNISVHNLIDNHIINYLREIDKPSRTYWPYLIQLKSWADVSPAERFCYTHFKSRNWRNISADFYFKHKEDYEWFMLRWS